MLWKSEQLKKCETKSHKDSKVSIIRETFFPFIFCKYINCFAIFSSSLTCWRAETLLICGQCLWKKMFFNKSIRPANINPPPTHTDTHTKHPDEAPLSSHPTKGRLQNTEQRDRRAVSHNGCACAHACLMAGKIQYQRLLSPAGSPEVTSQWTC